MKTLISMNTADKIELLELLESDVKDQHDNSMVCAYCYAEGDIKIQRINDWKGYVF